MWMFEGVIQEFLKVLPITLLLTALLFVISWIIRHYRGSQKHSLILLFMTCFYLSFLIYGTCLSRTESLSDFLDFGRWSKGIMTINMLPTSEYSFDNPEIIHALLNLVLFLPWGILGFIYFPRPKGIIICTISALLMSMLIEVFQRSHGMGFVIQDITFNTAGGFLGAFITWPIFAWFRSRRKQHV